MVSQTSNDSNFDVHQWQWPAQSVTPRWFSGYLSTPKLILTSPQSSVMKDVVSALKPSGCWHTILVNHTRDRLGQVDLFGVGEVEIFILCGIDLPLLRAQSVGLERW